ATDDDARLGNRSGGSYIEACQICTSRASVRAAGVPLSRVPDLPFRPPRSLWGHSPTGQEALCVRYFGSSARLVFLPSVAPPWWRSSRVSHARGSGARSASATDTAAWPLATSTSPIRHRAAA